MIRGNTKEDSGGYQLKEHMVAAFFVLLHVHFHDLVIFYVLHYGVIFCLGWSYKTMIGILYFLLFCVQALPMNKGQVCGEAGLCAKGWA